MKDDLARAIAEAGNDPRLKSIVEEVCSVTGMGFAAIACVTRDRWIACQVQDQIEFGLDAGRELEVQTTICNDIRDSGRAIVIDDVITNDRWRRHPTPILYGFKSYASFPVILKDGTFFGTLCAIDPAPRQLSAGAIISYLEDAAQRVATILSDFLAGDDRNVAASIINVAILRNEPADMIPKSGS